MKKILIIDDEEELVEVLASRLEANGYETKKAYNGIQGLEILENDTFELIILDLNMPEMGGIEFYQKLCGEDDKSPIPVLVLTARQNMEQLFKEFQVDGFMTKPFESEQLLEEINCIVHHNIQYRSDGSSKRIVIVNNLKDELKEIKQSFIEGGFEVETTDKGVRAIEMIVKNPPELCLIKLGLEDLPGDLVILQLQQLAKTRHVPCVLYSDRNHTLDRIVFNKFAEKSGVRLVREFTHPTELVEIVQNALIDFQKERDGKVK